FSSRRRHTRFSRDWSSDVCSSDLASLDFVTQKLNIETVDQNKLSMIQDKVLHIVNRIEPDVKVVFDFEDKVYEQNREGIQVELRSEERRVGKECRCRWWMNH